MQAQNTNPGLSLLVRIFFGVVALVLIVGIALFFVPELVTRRWPWALTPFNTRFLGAFYLAELAVVLVQLRVNRWSPGRLALPLALAFTGLVSLVSLLYLNQFDFQHRAVWTWFIIYLGSALVSALFLWQYRRQPIPEIAWPTSFNQRTYLQIEAILLGLYGLGLLLAPALFSAFWPWKLDNFHGQLYSAIFTTGALGVWLLSRRAAAVEYLAVGLAQLVQGLFAILGLSIVDMAVHKLNWAGPGTWLWIGLFALIFASGLSKIRLAQMMNLSAKVRSVSPFSNNLHRHSQANGVHHHHEA